MKRPLLAVLLCCLLLLLSACKRGETYGTGVDGNTPAVTVKDIFLKPELIGKNVTVNGSVYTQCQSNGCWFVLQDSTGQIYIDLSRNNFSIPASVGKTAKATGRVIKQRNEYFLIAQGVEVQ